MPDEHIQVDHRHVTTVAPLDTTEIKLRLIDWRRIYRKVSGIYPGFSGRELIAGVSWGITTSAGLSLVSLYQSKQPIQGLEPWVKPSLWAAFAASAVIGFVVWRGAKNYAKDVGVARDELLEELQELHCLYFPHETLGGLPKPRPLGLVAKWKRLLSFEGGKKKPELEIHSALYGDGNDKTDVTAALAAKIHGDAIETQCGNHIGGDPCPGRGKNMHVVFSFRGKREEKDFQENSLVKIP